MNCTSHCCAIDRTFDSRVARREIERYRRKGPSPSTRRLVRMMRDTGASGATVLDVGGGVGTIAHELLGAGAERATVVDASASYLNAAREETARRGTTARLQLVNGDFVKLAPEILPADIVTLDKVVCCYPDMEQLLATSTAHASRLYGIVYPRDVWWLRAAMAAQNALFRLGRSAFRVYVFPNAAIDAAVRRAGFEVRRHDRGFVWVVALYERSTSR